MKVRRRSADVGHEASVPAEKAGYVHIFRSAYRAMLLTDRLERSLQSKRLTDLSSELGFDKATAHRLLETLVAERVVVKEADTGHYTSDATSWAHFGDYLRPAIALISSAQALLDQVAAEASATCLLVLPLLDSRAVVAPMYAIPDRSLYLDPGRGTETSILHATAAGKCYLANLSKEELDRYLARPLESNTKKAVTSPSALRKQLAKVRQDGYALNRAESEEGISLLSVPLQTPSGGTAGGLALGFIGEAVAERQLEGSLPLLKTAAGQLSRLMTYASWVGYVEQTGADRLRPHPLWDSPDPPTAEGGLARVRTVARAARLTSLLFTHAAGLSVGEVAHYRKLAKSAAWRLLNTLAAAGVVWQDAPEARYRISPLFWLARARILLSATSRERAIISVLAEIAQQVGQTTSIGVPRWGGRRLLIPWYALPDRMVCCHPTSGPSGFLHTTAAGKCYLAALPRFRLEDYIRQGLPSLTGRSITSREQLLQELEDVSRQGYALSTEETGLGVSALAVPLRGAGGAVLGSLAIAAVATQVTAEQLREWLPVLRAAANRLAHLLPQSSRE